MAEADQTSFTLATYNIHVGVPMGKAIGVQVSTSADLDNVTAAMAETSADVVALQEVDCEYRLSFPGRRLPR
jgi:endonuclease/exonuclease/phosphatase family metal-dependent hydrolase